MRKYSLACNVREIQACVSTTKDILVFFSNSEKLFSLQDAQLNGKCPDSSPSRLKRHCSTKWIEDHDAVFVFNKFYPVIVGYLDQLVRIKRWKGS